MARPTNPPAPADDAFSPASQPILDFIEAYDAVIAAEWARLHRLPRYYTRAAEAHEEWMRYHEEGNQTILCLGKLRIKAIRAGRLAGDRSCST